MFARKQMLFVRIEIDMKPFKGVCYNSCKVPGCKSLPWTRGEGTTEHNHDVKNSSLAQLWKP